MQKTMTRGRALIALALALYMTLGAPFAEFAMAATRLVSAAGTDSGDCTLAPCRSISYAAEISGAGDTINVGAGTYNMDTEAFPIMGSNLTIQGAGAGLSVIDATGALMPFVAIYGMPAVVYYDEQTAATKLDGFSIITDSAPAVSIAALNSSAPTISNNSITTSMAMASIAMYAYNSFYSAVITMAPQITDNTIQTDSSMSGIGVFKYPGGGPRKPAAAEAAPTLSGSTVSGSALRSGLLITYTSYPYIPPSPKPPASIALSGTISGNTISGGFFGIGMYSYYYGMPKATSAAERGASCCGSMELDFAPVISGNTISSAISGVLIVDFAYSGDTIRPAITGNTIETPENTGIEMFMRSYGNGMINTSVSDNIITGAGGGIVIGNIFGASTNATLSNNTVTGTFSASPYGYMFNAGAIIYTIGNYDTTVTVDHNTIAGFDTGLLSVGTVGSSTITNNSITDNSGYGVMLAGGYFGPTKPASAEKSASRFMPTGAGSFVMSNNTITGSMYAASLYGNATYYGETPGFDLGGGALGSTGLNTLTGSTSDLENNSPATASAMSNWFSDTPVVTENPGLVNYTALENQLSLSLTPADGLKDGSAAFVITAASAGTFFQTGIGSSSMPNNISVTFGGNNARLVSVTPDGKTITGLAPASAVDGAVDVVVTNPGGQTGSIAEAFSYLPSSPNAPTAPVLIFPTDGADGINPDNILFKWLASTDADGDIVAYDLYVCEDPTFESCPSPVNSVRVASIETDSMYAGGMGSGLIGSIGLVMTGMAMAGGLSRRRRIALLLLIAAMAAFASMTLVSCGISGGEYYGNQATYTVSGLDSDTTYYWKVVAYDGTGNLTESPVYSFTTQ